MRSREELASIYEESIKEQNKTNRVPANSSILLTNLMDGKDFFVYAALMNF